MKINWNYPTSIWVGDNRIKDLSKACSDLEISKPLFVTDKYLITINFNLKNSFNFLFFVIKMYL